MNILKFCSKDENREKISLPWKHGNHEYATDGHVVVRCPVEGNHEKPAHVPDALNIWDTVKITDEYRDCPTPKTNGIIVCEACGGSGRKFCCPCCGCKDSYAGEPSNFESMTCSDCDGKGEHVSTIKWTDVFFPNGVVRIADLYLTMIADLPGLQITRSECGRYVHFKFDGGDGFIIGQER